MEIDGVTTLSFDCYGTLIDWETGIWDALQPLILHNRADHISRLEALEAHSSVEAAQQLATPALAYTDLLALVHAGLADTFGLITAPEMDRAFGDSMVGWPAFADVATSLRTLSRRFELVILSNVDRIGFAASAPKLGVTFDAIFTAEDIGSYKPDVRNFEFMLDALDLDRSSILHVAQSLFHDHGPARAVGLSNVWIDRQGLRSGSSRGATAEVEQPPAFDHRFDSLEAMVSAMGL